MIKQILGRFPKKPSKSGDKDPIGRSSPSVPNPPLGPRDKVYQGGHIDGRSEKPVGLRRVPAITSQS
uniref:Uncharacterized protein n=2 Tax=Oryza TaxID=4527 RepID=A0A0E0D9H5_9ORYZ